MNNEIKIRHELNILSNTILDDTTYKPTISRRKLLLDYITNLQQEKDTYKEQLRITHKDLEHYISRCEKAIEYIENPRHEMSVLTYQNLLNILQNGSEDND